MKINIKDLQTRLYIIAAVILAVGSASAVLIYQTAGDETGDGYGYEIVNGRAYPVRPEDTKMYRHDLELYGGKFNVMADEFTRWFAGLWHGRTLAFMVACVAAVASFWFFFAAWRLPSLKSDDRDENSRAGRNGPGKT